MSVRNEIGGEKSTNLELTAFCGGLVTDRHLGQGTANRAIIFKENYLEFIFMDLLGDAKKNPLRLDKRAEWNNTCASPFGICLGLKF
ncbi:MAG: hypothetical protein ACM3MG_00270 [Bacillota bacterium]